LHSYKINSFEDILKHTGRHLSS